MKLRRFPAYSLQAIFLENLLWETSNSYRGGLKAKITYFSKVYVLESSIKLCEILRFSIVAVTFKT